MYMYSVFDIANYLIELSVDMGEPLTNMKLQKLLYYSYAWYFVDKKGQVKLFDEPIYAWKYGPVITTVYEEFKKYGADIITQPSNEKGDTSKIDNDAKELIKETFIAYADKTAIQLMRLTHSEVPWMQTFDQTNLKKQIPDDQILKFYSEKRDNILSEQYG